MSFNDFTEGVDDAPEVIVDKSGKPSFEKQTETVVEPKDAPDETFMEQVEPPKSETEKPQETPQEEQKPELSKYEQLFLQEGLDKQFPGGLEQMISNMRNYNKSYTEALQRKAAIEKQSELRPSPQPEPVITQDQFVDDPIKVVQQVVKQALREQEAKAQTFNAQMIERTEQIAVENFRSAHPDVEQYLPDMVEALESNPWLYNALPSERMPILYNMAKAKNIPRLIKDAVEKAKSPTKDSTKAETSTGKPVRKTSPEFEDIVKMSDKELERFVGVKSD